MAAEISELTMVRRANIKMAMEAGGWTRREFATKTGVNYATLSGIMGETPRGNVGTRVANQIEAALNKQIGWLDKDRSGVPAVDIVDPPREGITVLPTEGAVTMNAHGLIVLDRIVTRYQANEIMKILLED